MNSEKQKVLPGVSTSEAYFFYELKLKVKKQTVFKNIILNDSIIIENFSVTDNDSNIQRNKNSIFEKGIYLLQFSVSKNKIVELSNDNIFIEFTQNNITKSIQTNTKKATLINLK